jgi:hypothetical protein
MGFVCNMLNKTQQIGVFRLSNIQKESISSQCVTIKLKASLVFAYYMINANSQYVSAEFIPNVYLSIQRFNKA